MSLTKLLFMVDALAFEVGSDASFVNDAYLMMQPSAGSNVSYSMSQSSGSLMGCVGFLND